MFFSDCLTVTYCSNEKNNMKFCCKVSVISRHYDIISCVRILEHWVSGALQSQQHGEQMAREWGWLLFKWPIRAWTQSVKLYNVCMDLNTHSSFFPLAATYSSTLIYDADLLGFTKSQKYIQPTWHDTRGQGSASSNITFVKCTYSLALSQGIFSTSLLKWLVSVDWISLWKKTHNRKVKFLANTCLEYFHQQNQPDCVKLIISNVSVKQRAGNKLCVSSKSFYSLSRVPVTSHSQTLNNYFHINLSEHDGGFLYFF